MLRLAQKMPFASACCFRDGFWTPASVMNNGGIIVASTISNGISPTGVSGRVTYNGTQEVGINSSEMTIRFQMRTGTITVGSARRLLTKAPLALNDNQFIMHLEGGNLLTIYVANAPADIGQLIRMNAPVVSNTEYLFHFVYKGSLAAASRGVIYNQGLTVASTITGTLPPTMRASGQPLVLFQLAGESNLAPATDTIVRNVRIYSRAYNAAEVLLDAQDKMYWS